MREINFMIDIYILSAVVIFILGVVVLRKMTTRRYFVFFLLETKRGLNFVDRVSSVSPSFWKFLGDVAVTISFGGLGSYYISRYRNLWSINFILGLFCLIFVFANHGIFLTLLGFLILTTGLFFVRRYPHNILQALATATIMSIIMMYNFPIFSSVEILKPFVSILFGIFGIPALVISMLSFQAFKILVGESTVPGVSPLLPTISEEGPGFFFPGTGIVIPFWQAVIAIICLLVPHEFMHGVLTRAHKIRLKSAGVLTAGPLPIGAFVEPDENIFKLRKSREKLRIYAAGSFANLVVAFFVVIIMLWFLTPLVNSIVEPSGILILNVINGTPADGVLEKGYIITSINGMSTKNIKEFTDVLSKLAPNQTVEIATTNGTFNLTLASKPDNASRAYIGIDLRENFELKPEFKEKQRWKAEMIFFIATALFWIFFLSFNIALVNLLPINPFDGGKMFEEIMNGLGVKRNVKEGINRFIIVLIVMLLFLNAAPLLKLI